jgi:hypothetical protein
LNIKNTAHRVIDSPARISKDEVIHALYVVSKFDRGEREIRDGKGVSDDKARKRRAKWQKRFGHSVHWTILMLSPILSVARTTTPSFPFIMVTVFGPKSVHEEPESDKVTDTFDEIHFHILFFRLTNRLFAQKHPTLRNRRHR